MQERQGAAAVARPEPAGALQAARAAVERLEARQNEEQIAPAEELLEALRSGEPAARRSAAQQLPRAPDVETQARFIIEELLHCLEGWRLPPEEISEPLIAVLRERSAELAQACFLLAKYSEDETFAVRKGAVEVAGALLKEFPPNTELDMAAPWLLERLSDEEALVREAAAKTVGRVAHRGDASALTCLQPLLEDKMPKVRLAAVTAVGFVARAGDRDALGAASARVHDAEYFVREAAVMIGKQQRTSATWS